jgi:Zn-dependent alcohol dehydrogenase
LERGSSVRDIEVGDKVLLSYNFCGECTQCRGNYPAYCETLMQLNFGGKRPDGSSTMYLPNNQDLFSNFFGQSSFAKIAVVSKSSVVRVPPTTDLQLFAPLGCGMQTGAGAVLNTLNVRPGSSVVVFGVGCVGLAGVMAAKIREARIIVAVDLQPERLELARDLGATHTFCGNDPDIRKHITDLCGSSRGADFALDCSGAIPVIENMIATLGIRGKAASIGAPAPGRKAEVDVFSHLTMGRQYIGCHQGDSVATEVCHVLAIVIYCAWTNEPSR